jgi:hypothetical protein
MITGSSVAAYDSRMIESASRPDNTGIAMSMSTRSTYSSRTRSMASRPVAADRTL